MAIAGQCPCPTCGTPGRWLESLSKNFAYVDYYLCRPCHHIWTVPKHECEPADQVQDLGAG